MCFKKITDKIDEMELDNKIILFVFLIIGMFAGIAYIGVLIVPNWQIFIDYPWSYQLVSYGVICLILLDLTFVIIITLKTAINNQILVKLNKDLEDGNLERNEKIKELEAELNRLKRDD